MGVDAVIEVEAVGIRSVVVAQWVRRILRLLVSTRCMRMRLSLRAVMHVGDYSSSGAAARISKLAIVARRRIN